LAQRGKWVLALLAVACGKSMSHSSVTDSAGTGGGAQPGGKGGATTPMASGGVGAANAGTSAVGSGGRAASGGTSTSRAGSTSVAGAGGASGGTVGSGATAGSGVAGAGLAGMGAVTSGGAAGASMGGMAGLAAVGGTADDGGAGGSIELDCQGSYDRCGCGCCSAPTNPGCYYPEHGDDLAAIKSEDQATATSPDCANAGCALGTHLVCCEAAPPDENAVNEITYFSSDTVNTWFIRSTLDQRCTSLLIPTAALTGPISFAFPEQWPIADASTRDGECDNFGRSPDRSAIGALGTLARNADCYAAFDADFTLFFSTDSGAVDSVRFKGSFLPGSNGGPLCP